MRDLSPQELQQLLVDARYLTKGRTDLSALESMTLGRLVEALIGEVLRTRKMTNALLGQALTRTFLDLLMFRTQWPQTSEEVQDLSHTLTVSSVNVVSLFLDPND